MKTKLALTAALMISPLLSDGVQAQEKPETREDVEQIVREYLLENPEIIAEAIQELQMRRESAAAIPIVNRYRDWLEKDPFHTVMGNPEGTVTLYEFFDFRCGYCRRHFPVLKQLVANNPDLKIVFKQYPILDSTADGPSRQAALTALYANSKGKGAEFHDALMSISGSVTNETIRSTASAVGLDLADLDKEVRNSRITSALDSSVYVGRELRFDGTPSYIIGDRVFSGGVGLKQMQQAIDRARGQKSR